MRIFLGIFVFLIWASICRYGWVCTAKGLCKKAEPKIEDYRPNTLDLILDDSITYLQGYDQFVFKNGLVDPDLNKNNNVYLDSLAIAMKSDTAIYRLKIIGHYRGSEKEQQSGFYENLGIARAAAIEKLLTQRGVKEANISIDSKLGSSERLIEPLDFIFSSDRSGIPTEYVTPQFKFTNMTFSDANFEKGSPVFIPGEALKLYADSVKTFLNLNSEKSLTIVGHCDSDGTDQYNLELGKNRAENAKLYFQKLGVTSTINTVSKGKSEPAFPNDTELNKQKNRRVNFILK